MTETLSEQRKRGRSPGYPAIDLGAAVERVRELYDREHRHAAPLNAIFGHWGYKSSGGNANLVISALRKFGLVDYEGSGESRKARVSELAVEILQHPDLGQRREAIKRAALMPTIHQELWSKFGGNLPSDDALRWELQQERSFTPSGVTDFIPQYKATLSYAGLLERDTGPQEHPTGSDTGSADEIIDERHNRRTERERPQASRRSGVKTVTFPLVDVGEIIIEGDFPMPEEAWAQFMAVLDALKPSMVGKRVDSCDEQPAPA